MLFLPNKSSSQNQCGPLVTQLNSRQFNVRATVTLPVVVPCGFTSTVKVPVDGRATGFKVPVLLLQMPVDARELPSGLRILTTTPLQPTYVLPVRLRLACCADVPLNEYRAFWPETVVVAVIGVPGVIVPVTSEKTLRRTVTLPVVVHWGFTSRV
jgi:hypothetical protein